MAMTTLITIVGPQAILPKVFLHHFLAVPVCALTFGINSSTSFATFATSCGSLPSDCLTISLHWASTSWRKTRVVPGSESWPICCSIWRRACMWSLLQSAAKRLLRRMLSARWARIGSPGLSLSARGSGGGAREGFGMGFARGGGD